MTRAGAAVVLAALTVPAALLVAPRTARAQDSRWENQVREQIRRAGTFLQERGYSLTHDVYTGSLGERETASLTITLAAGRSYALLAVCDEDCSDVDLRLFDAGGAERDSDVELDDNPIVQISPRETGPFRLRVIMARCTTAPCFYGIGVFGK